MIARGLVLTLLLQFTANALADDRKIWACSSFGEGAKPIVYLVDWGSQSYIKFSNQRIAAAYSDKESTQEWVWGNRGGFYNYSIALGRDNLAVYHDFSDVGGGETANATDTFRCNQIQ